MAQQSRAGRARSKKHPREAGSDHMMSGLLVCRKCNEHLQVRPRHDPNICDYVCKTRRNETVSTCDCPNVCSRDFEPLFLKAVTEDILSPKNTETAIEVVAQELGIPYEEQLSRLELIEKEILNLQKKQDRVMDAYEAGNYKLETFDRRIAPLRKQEDGLKESRIQAEMELGRDAAIVANPQMVMDFSKDMAKAIRHSPPKETKELIQRFVTCVWIEPRRATIVYRIPMPNDGLNPRATKRELALDGEPVSVRPTARGGPPTRG